MNGYPLNAKPLIDYFRIFIDPASRAREYTFIRV